MTLKSPRSAFFACLILGPATAGAKAADCDGAISADEAAVLVERFRQRWAE